jgi:hypothetical protein
MYDEPVERAVLSIWDFFHLLCGRWLIPLIRANPDALAAEFNLSGKYRKNWRGSAAPLSNGY